MSSPANNDRGEEKSRTTTIGRKPTKRAPVGAFDLLDSTPAIEPPVSAPSPGQAVATTLSRSETSESTSTSTLQEKVRNRAARPDERVTPRKPTNSLQNQDRNDSQGPCPLPRGDTQARGDIVEQKQRLRSSNSSAAQRRERQMPPDKAGDRKQPPTSSPTSSVEENKTSAPSTTGSLGNEVNPDYAESGDTSRDESTLLASKQRSRPDGGAKSRERRSGRAREADDSSEASGHSAQRNVSHSLTSHGAYAVGSGSKRSETSWTSNPPDTKDEALHPVEATLVDHSQDREIMRDELLGDIVHADTVDVDKERRNAQAMRCGVLFTFVTALALGLGFGLTSKDTAPQNQPPTEPPTVMPSAAPTEFTIALCSPYTFVDDPLLYTDTVEGVLDTLAMDGVNVTLDDEEICSPRSKAVFNLAILLQDQSLGDTFTPPPGEDRNLLGTTAGISSFAMRYALGVLFFALKGESWDSTENWLQSIPMCTWENLECTDSGSLVKIELNSNDLEGTIPTEIGLVVTLEHLNLNENDINGTLPTELGFLTQLEEMEIRENDMSGVIPSELGELRRMTHLDIRHNNLVGELHPSLFQATNLRKVDISENNLNGSLPTELGFLKELEYFYVHDNYFTGEIPTHFGALGRLEKLEGEENNFSGQLPSEIFDLPRMEAIVFDNNYLTGAIPEIGTSPRLSNLSLRTNNFNSTLPTTLGNLNDLTILDLRNNTFHSTLPSELGRLIRLREMNLESNEITGEIPSEIGNLESLLDLDLARNGLEGFPSWLGRLSSLEALDLQHNDLSATIPTEIGRLTRLTEINLKSSELRGSIASELALLPRLVSLLLDDNKLSGSVESLAFPALQTFSAADNLLTGPLLSSSNLENTVLLDLSQNDLTGTIPTTYGDLDSMLFLRLSDNPRISGTIPTELGTSQLREVDLRNTAIEGPIDAVLCNTESGLTLLVDVNCPCCSAGPTGEPP